MWVLIALASLVAVIILVLCVPLDMVFNVEVYGRLRFRMRLAWLFGMVDKEIKKGKKKPEEKKMVVAGKRKRRMRISARTIIRILRIKGLPRQFIEFLKDLLGQFRIRNIRADFRLGLDDPADTGILFSLLSPAELFLDSFLPCRIRVHPSLYGEAVFEGCLCGTVRLRPIQVVKPFIGFIFSLPTIRTIKLLVLSKWKKKS